MTLTTTLLTLFALLAAWEAFRAIYCRSMYAMCSKYHALPDAESKKFYRSAHPCIYLMLCMDFIGFATLGVALFTTGIWPMAAGVFLLSARCLKCRSTLCFFMDAIATLSLYLGCIFVLINQIFIH